MTARITKPKCLLLDSNVIIGAHELGIWSQFIGSYQLVIPATICRHEANYYYNPKGIKQKIDLSDQISKGIITELEAMAEDIASLLSIFAPWFVDIIHDGEKEALALLQAGKIAEAFFCTSDPSAIKALAMMHKSHLGISFEVALSKIGLTGDLHFLFGDDFFQRNLRIGQRNLITGEGLVES